MKSVYAIAAVIFAAELGYFLHGYSAEDADPCDLHEVERAPYCARCRTVDPPVDLDGTCCGARPRNVEVCVKTCFLCEACGRRRLTEDPCCLGARTIRIELKSPLVLRCEGCGTPATDEGLCSRPACRAAGRRVTKTCADSGRWPHGGELARQ